MDKQRKEFDLISPVINQIATPLGTTFFTDEEVVAQDDYKLFGSEVEFITAEFDQQKYEEFLSSGSTSPKEKRRLRKFTKKSSSPPSAVQT